MKKRKTISKKIRFEIFKRDSFKCQYCGNSAPQVLLHIDHIKPVAKGGTDAIANLITACEGCNSGKSDIPLSDNAAVDKQRKQLEALQERREQLEMMMQWHDLLVSEKDSVIEKLVDYWKNLTHNTCFLTQAGKTNLRKYCAKHSFEDIIKAMDVASSLFVYVNDSPTNESVNIAFGKIPGIIRSTKLYEVDPDLKDFHYIRGIIKNRCNTHPADLPLLIDWMRAAKGWGASINEIKQCALTAYSVNKFSDLIDDLIESYKN